MCFAQGSTYTWEQYLLENFVAHSRVGQSKATGHVRCSQPDSQRHCTHGRISDARNAVAVAEQKHHALICYTNKPM